MEGELLHMCLFETYCWVENVCPVISYISVEDVGSKRVHCFPFSPPIRKPFTNASWWHTPKQYQTQEQHEAAQESELRLYNSDTQAHMPQMTRFPQQINKNNFPISGAVKMGPVGQFIFTLAHLWCLSINSETFGADCHFSLHFLSPLVPGNLLQVNQGRSRPCLNKTLLSSFHTNNFKDRMSCIFYIYIYTTFFFLFFLPPTSSPKMPPWSYKSLLSTWN